MRRGTSFMAGPPTGRPRPGFGRSPTPSPRPRLLVPGDAGGDMRTVGHIRIVAGILDDDRLGPTLPYLAPLDLESHTPLLALAGEPHLHPFLRLAADERRGGGFCGGGGAGSGGPAGPERLALDPLHARGHGGFTNLASGRHLCSLSLPLSLAERVGEGGAVQVRTRSGRLKTRSH